MRGSCEQKVEGIEQVTVGLVVVGAVLLAVCLGVQSCSRELGFF